MADSPAERAGLKAGDRIHSVNGDPEGMLSAPAGTPLTLSVQREGRADPIEVQLTVEWTRKWTWRNFETYDLFEDREGVLWIGLGYGEIVRWDVRGQDPDVEASIPFGLDSFGESRRAQNEVLALALDIFPQMRFPPRGRSRTLAPCRISGG